MIAPGFHSSRLCPVTRVYEPNPKHKPWASGDGPPRWFPDSASTCPNTINTALAQELLDGAIEGRDLSQRNDGALYMVHEGEFYKAYCSKVLEDIECWHGYPVPIEQVPRAAQASVPKMLKYMTGIRPLSSTEFRFVRRAAAPIEPPVPTSGAAGSTTDALE